MKTFQDFYHQSTEKQKVDGIIAMDTHVLVSTIKVLDDQITVDGQTYTTKIDPHCNCPQVIYALENNISRPVGYIKADRKGLLGQMLVALLQKSFSSSPKVYWGPLFQTLIAETTQKHVQFDLFDQNAQSGLEALNAAGRIRAFDGDYLHINEANFSGAKTNLFIDETVDMNYQRKDDGSIEKTVTIKYKNSFPPSDCNLERGGLCLNAEHRDWIRLYVPKGSQLIDEKGSIVKMSSYDELGKTVFDGFLTVRPLGSSIFTVSYRLPFKTSDANLPIMVQKQSGTDGFHYTISKNGIAKQEFQLYADKETKISL